MNLTHPRALVVSITLLLAACGAPPAAPVSGRPAAELAPPVAAQRPHDVVSPNGTRSDPYYWLRDDTRSDPDVLGYLNAENAYTEAMLAPATATAETLYAEFLARMEQDDASVPVWEDGYWSYVRYETGKQYPIYCRRKGSMEAAEEIVLDANVLGQGEAYFKVAGLTVSPDGSRVAYAEDRVGRGQYRLRVRDLASGALLASDASNVDPGAAWANDSKTLFYVGKDATTLRGRYVLRHEVGANADDVLVHDETDESFEIGIARTKSGRYVRMMLANTDTYETRLIDSDRPTAPARTFLPRERAHEYSVDHLGERFVILTNWQAPNFRIMEVDDSGDTAREAWREVLPHRDNALVAYFDLLDDAIAVAERSGGMRRVRVLPRKGEPFVIPAPETPSTMYLSSTPEPDARTVRYMYTSMTTPHSTYELDLDTGEQRLLKQTQVLGDFDPHDYVTEYVHATAADGTKVPISLVRHRATPIDGTAPLLVYGYGSYGISMEASFSPARLSLLDRGWVYATAHVRGGQEMGRRWYEAGRRFEKKNTFTDFITCTEHLVAQGYGARDKVFAMGGSAGGLLMGAIANMRPDLYRGVLAAVPFVDVMTTMLDESLPLTVGEFDEWGNPKDKDAYDYMLSYSPYDNVVAQAYPAMLVTTGLWDSQVQYFEPAKWVARLRATKTDGNPLLLLTNMDAGHGGKSGRYQALRETARDYAFFLRVLQQPDARAEHTH